jgi:membrane protease YdiL (CAAX protease family)
MTPARRNPFAGVTRTRAISAAVVVALIAGALLLSDGPVWIGAALAVLAAIGLGLAYRRDRRRGQRWF